jgi:hypothetical protein
VPCTILRKALYEAALRQPKFASVHDHGVVCSAWGRFETAHEIKAFAGMGAHVVGHTLAYESPVFRKAGVRLAALNIVSNYAEGEAQWVGERPESMHDFYAECPHFVGPVMVDALRSIMESGVEAPDSSIYYLSGLGQLPVDGA